MRSRLLLTLVCCMLLHTLCAQTPEPDTIKVKVLPPIQKFYVGNAMDALIFSTATIQRTNINTGATTNSMAALRFSAFLNVGATFNWNLARFLGIYTGVDMKNVGFIEHLYGYTFKRRTYNIGAPVGIKIGNMASKGAYLFLGGGVDVPVNYKEKQFVVRDEKTKTSAWFSSNTAAVMPYVFAGISLRCRVTVKAQYYPGNYLAASYISEGNTYDVHLVLLSIGYRLNYSRHNDAAKNSVEKTKLM